MHLHTEYFYFEFRSHFPEAVATYTTDSYIMLHEPEKDTEVDFSG